MYILEYISIFISIKPNFFFIQKFCEKKLLKLKSKYILHNYISQNSETTKKFLTIAKYSNHYRI